MSTSHFDHHLISVNSVSIHLIESGNKEKQTVLFLHGYPENALAYEQVMNLLKEDYHLLAIDLPGIGLSEPIECSDKKQLAGSVNNLIETLNLEKINLVGHDVGGMITYSFLKNFPDKLSKAIIMNTAIPGVEPWELVKANPYIWHFSFFAIPSLPETLIEGKQKALFDYFYNTISFNKDAITETKREQYAADYGKMSALTTSLNWYRAFPQDEKDNSANSVVETPVLYLKGEKDFGDIETYLEGFRKRGIQNITGKLISKSGHFSPEENPQEVADAIRGFLG